jgi:hypothetical protein
MSIPTNEEIVTSFFLSYFQDHLRMRDQPSPAFIIAKNPGEWFQLKVNLRFKIPEGSTIGNKLDIEMPELTMLDQKKIIIPQ